MCVLMCSQKSGSHGRSLIIVTNSHLVSAVEAFNEITSHSRIDIPQFKVSLANYKVNSRSNSVEIEKVTDSRSRNYASNNN